MEQYTAMLETTPTTPPRSSAPSASPTPARSSPGRCHRSTASFRSGRRRFSRPVRRSGCGSARASDS